MGKLQKLKHLKLRKYFIYSSNFEYFTKIPLETLSRLQSFWLEFDAVEVDDPQDFRHLWQTIVQMIN